MKVTKLIMLVVAAVWSAGGHACEPVAKLAFVEPGDIGRVHVTRASRGTALPVDVLCIDDVVYSSTSNGVRIRYMRRPPLEVFVSAGQSAAILKVATATSNGKSFDLLNILGAWLSDPAVSPVQRARLSLRGDPGGAEALGTPLAMGQPAGTPLLLRRSTRNIAFAWFGGKSPWRVELVDDRDQTIERVESTSSNARFNDLDAALVSRVAFIRVTSMDGRVFAKPILVVTEESESEPGWTSVAELIGREGKGNWRLQIYSDAWLLPPSTARDNLINHLEQDDVQ